MDLEQKLAQERPETRSVAFTDIDTSSDGSKFTGYAAVFDHEADLGDFTESISRGAFRKALAGGPNVPMLYDHNPGLPVLATTGGGTLKLKEDGKGLRVEANVANHFVGDAVREMVQRGDIRGMSFGFVAGAGNSRIEKRDGKPHRNLTGFKALLDVSPTWDPAYQGTNAEIRSLRAVIDATDLEELEERLRLPDIRELRALVAELDGLQSIAARIEAALAGIRAEAGTDEQDDEPDGESEVTPDPGADVEAEVEAETPAAKDAGDEQRSGVDSADAEAAARTRRLQMLGLSLPR